MDPDRKLARFLAGSRDNELIDVEHEITEDPLFVLLEQYRESSGLKRKAISSVRSPVLPSAGERTRWVLYRAAAILIAVSMIWLVFHLADSSQPQLIAESHGARVDHELPGGSEVALRPNSRLYRLEETGDLMHLKLKGEGYFSIQPDMGQTLLIEAGPARIRVTGTRFVLQSREDRARVYLEEGSVQFALRDGSQALEMQPGQAALAGPEELKPLEDVRPDVYMAWLQNEMILEQRSLEELVREIMYHFNIDISVDETLRHHVLSGSVALDDPASVLDDIAISVGAHVEYDHRGRYLLTAENQ